MASLLPLLRYLQREFAPARRAWSLPGDALNVARQRLLERPHKMEPDSSQSDSHDAAALVLRTLDDLNSRTEEQSVQFLDDLMCAAWGMICAQNQ